MRKWRGRKPGLFIMRDIAGHRGTQSKEQDRFTHVSFFLNTSDNFFTLQMFWNSTLNSFFQLVPFPTSVHLDKHWRHSFNKCSQAFPLHCCILEAITRGVRLKIQYMIVLCLCFRSWDLMDWTSYFALPQNVQCLQQLLSKVRYSTWSPSAVWWFTTPPTLPLSTQSYSQP